jgi:hypothetical protein
LNRQGRIVTFFVFLLLISLQRQVRASDYFVVSVVDEQTGRGVPLAELETVSHTRWWTDSNGLVAIDEPGLIGQEVYFFVRSDGYERPKDFFGFRGIKLKPARGGTVTIKLKRVNIAERLYRMTGEGIYRDTVLAERKPPTSKPLLNGQVAGQDTVIAAAYRKRIFWFWGDTERVGYPLGNFGASGATSYPPGLGGLDPAVGVNLTYFVGTDGFSKPMCPLPGKGLRWIEGLFPVVDDKGTERLVARVANVRDLGYVNDWHLMVFNDDREIFESVQRWDIHEGHDSAHPFLARVDGVSHYYIYPNWRVKADLKSLAKLSSYEALTCVSGDGKVDGKKSRTDRDETGHVRYSWKSGADRLHPSKIHELISAGKLKPEESWMQLHDFETGKPIEAGRGSVYWNNFRQRWVLIVTRNLKPGEIWFAEADTPPGPWVYARRVLSHENYNFYNPTQHPFFDQEGGRLIYFEGTYTAAFSAAHEKTPRYDYNQIMYRLTLDDQRLALPAPVYRINTVDGHERYSLREGIGADWESVKEAAFFAIPPSRSATGLTPIFARSENGKIVLQTAPQSSGNVSTAPLFFALSVTNASRVGTITGLWRCKATLPEGTVFPFDMNLLQRGTNIEITATENVSRGSGAIKSARLTLKMDTVGREFFLSGLLEAGAIRGEWKQSDDGARGAWSGEWIDQTPTEFKSTAVTALYDYIQPDGEHFYSTDPALNERSLKREAEPLCRVWNNPMATLVLDTKAQPVAFGSH